MMQVIITKETSQMEGREIKIFCPVWLWHVLEKRAETLHKGNLQACVNELFADYALGWFQEAVQKVVPIGSSQN